MSSTLDRNVVIGQIISMMRQIEYPATRLTKIMNQLTDEKNQNLMNTIFAACSQAVSTYLPTENKPAFKKEVADFFLKKAKKAANDKDLQNFCVEKAIEFMTMKDNLKVAADWILNGKVTVDGDALNCELTPQQKYTIVKKYWASTDFNQGEKDTLKEKVFSNDESDAGLSVQKVLPWSLPDEALKTKLWEEITDPNSKESLMDVRMKISGFWQPGQQLDLMTPYFEKYYAILKKVIDERDREFA